MVIRFYSPKLESFFHKRPIDILAILVGVLVISIDMPQLSQLISLALPQVGATPLTLGTAPVTPRVVSFAPTTPPATMGLPPGGSPASPVLGSVRQIPMPSKVVKDACPRCGTLVCWSSLFNSQHQSTITNNNV